MRSSYRKIRDCTLVGMCFLAGSCARYYVQTSEYKSLVAPCQASGLPVSKLSGPPKERGADMVRALERVMDASSSKCQPWLGATVWLEEDFWEVYSCSGPSSGRKVVPWRVSRATGEIEAGSCPAPVKGRKPGPQAEMIAAARKIVRADASPGEEGIYIVYGYDKWVIEVFTREVMEGGSATFVLEAGSLEIKEAIAGL